MALRLKTIQIVSSREELTRIPQSKTLINTIYAYSYVVAQKDSFFAEALTKCDYLMPDGTGIVKACRWINAKCQPKERIAGWDLFSFEMDRINENDNDNHNKKPRVMFVGSSEKVLSLICKRAAIDYPNLEVVTYSPPYKPEFSDEDNLAMIQAINNADPDLLWIGMTAPKQEKWTYKHWNELNIHCHCGTIGAVFDFYAGTVKRAPLWWQRHSLEWFYRLLMEPRRMWRRYIIGNAKFLYYIYRERKGPFHEP
ncbi:MAG: WecB/TagA/CpsF family glycosyltransferase [Bacteroidaceae bacterium]|nr:WecB/TagA/CpsF family glycosyltransferase [Bacteroidaceae bacterium]